MSVTFTSTPTGADHIQSAMALTRSSIVATAIGTFATVTGALGLIVLRNPLVIPVLLLGLVMLTGLYIVPFVWWAIHQRRDLALAPVQVTADEHGISLATPTTSSRQEWSVYRQIRETPRAFILDTGASVAILLTKRGASDGEVAAFRDLAMRVGALRQVTHRDRLRPLVGVAIGLAFAAASILAPILSRPPA